MAKHLIMDPTGHSTVDFDKANKVDIEAAMARFKDLTSKGYMAAEIKPGGVHQQIRAFDPNIEETLFVPPLMGG